MNKETQNKGRIIQKLIIVISSIVIGFMIPGCLSGKFGNFDVIYAALEVIIVMLLLLKKGADIRSSARLRGFELKTTVYISLLIFGVSELLDLAAGAFLSKHMVIENQLPAAIRPENIFLLLILAPVFEELFFRFAAIGYIRSKSGMNRGILLSVIGSSLYAAVSHSCDIQHLPAILFSAVMLAVVYIYTDNILYTLSIHFILNLTMFIPFGTYSYVNGFAIANLPHVIACAVLALIGTVFFFGYFRPRYITRTYKPELEVISL